MNGQANHLPTMANQTSGGASSNTGQGGTYPFSQKYRQDLLSPKISGIFSKTFALPL